MALRQTYRWTQEVQNAQRQAGLGDYFAYDRPLQMIAARPGLELPGAPFRSLQVPGQDPARGPAESELTAVVRGSSSPHGGYGAGGSLQKFRAPPFGIAEDPGPNLDEAYVSPMGKSGPLYAGAYLGSDVPVLGGGWSGGPVEGPVPAFHGLTALGKGQVRIPKSPPHKKTTPPLNLPPSKSHQHLALWAAVAAAVMLFGMRSQTL